MKQTFAELLKARAEQQMQATVLEALLSIGEDSFLKKDGQKPKSMLVTADGQRIPTELIEGVLQDIRKTLLEPIETLVKQLDEREV